MKTIIKMARLYKKLKDYYDCCITAKEPDITKYNKGIIKVLLKEQNAPRGLVNGFMNTNMKSLNMPLVNATTLDLFELKELDMIPDVDNRVTIEMLAIINSLITAIVCYRHEIEADGKFDIVEFITMTTIAQDRADLYLSTEGSDDIDTKRAENAILIVNWFLNGITPLIGSICKYLEKNSKGDIYTTFSMVTHKSFNFYYFEIEDKKV